MTGSMGFGDQLQERLTRALTETTEDVRQSRFSDYGLNRHPTPEYFGAVAGLNGRAGVAAALDLFDKLQPTVDRGELRRALLLYLAHFPGGLVRLGLHLPSIAERSGWMLVPSPH